MKNVLFELAAKRRSIRRYTNEHINDDVLNEIMKVALAAPCSFGHRPVEFVIVRDRNKITELAACKSLGGSQIIGADAVIVVMVKLDRGEFWIEDESIHSELASWSGKYAVKMNPIAHYNLISNAAALVKGTENVAVCAEPACKFEGVKFIPFSPVLTMGNFVAWKRTSSQSKLETAFLQYIRSKLGLSEE
jgi:nitroreductase